MNEIISNIRHDSRAALFFVLLSAVALWAVVSNTLGALQQLPDDKVPVLSSAVQHTEKSLLRPESLASYHLFGRAPDISAVMPKTTLALTLEGVLLSGNAMRSSAIIASKNGLSKVYSIGETLPNGAALEKITGEFIVLKSEGRLEKLLLDRPEAMMQADLGSLY